VDPSYRIAIELLSQSNTQDYYLEAVPEISWDKVGGQAEALSAIKDAIELPLLHADPSEVQHQTPKGFLLYGHRGAERHCGQSHCIQSDSAAEAKDRRRYAAILHAH